MTISLLHFHFFYFLLFSLLTTQTGKIKGLEQDEHVYFSFFVENELKRVLFIRGRKREGRLLI
jgi:hypothetical protein